MNIQERIIQLHYEHTGNTIEINKVLLTILTQHQLFEPCAYMSEDENWLDVAIVSLEDGFSQSMSINKKDITAFGVFRKHDVDLPVQQSESTEDLYQ